MIHRNAFAAIAVAGAAMALPAHAANVAIIGNNAWHTFAVDAFLAPPSPASVNLGWIDDTGDPLHFTFVIGSGLAGTLTVLDTGFAGDMFTVTNFGTSFGTTSSVPVRQFDPAATSVEDFAVALADPSFSRGSFALAPGSYSIGGILAQSLMDGNSPLNSTSGAVRLSVIPVPEPSSYALMLAGLGVMVMLARRRRDPNLSR